MQSCLTIHSSVRPPVVVPPSELFAVELGTLLGSVVDGVGGTVLCVAQLVGPGGAFAVLPSICRSAREQRKTVGMLSMRECLISTSKKEVEIK